MTERPLVEGVTPELLDRYLAGEGTEAENASVRRFLMARPESARAVEKMLRELDGEAARPPAPNAQVSLEKLRLRMGQIAPPRASGPRKTPLFMLLSGRRPAPRWWQVTRVVAGLAAAAGISGIAWRGAWRSPPAPPPVEWRTYATNYGESAELRLIDGTRIRLAPASRLRVSSDYGDVRRDVHLEGEGYFDVVHDERRPFAVHARNTRAEDLGTEFGVRNYPEDDNVQVVVREGAVALLGVGLLEPGDVGRLTVRGESMIHHRVNVDSMLGWLEGRLAFDDTPLDEVARALRRWHAVEIELTDSSLASIPFTGSLNNASVDVAVKLVAATLGLRARRAGARVTLSPIAGRTPGRRAR